MALTQSWVKKTTKQFLERNNEETSTTKHVVKCIHACFPHMIPFPILTVI